MKAADFDYVAAASVADACRLLTGANGEGRIIAGGQTLVPMLAMRLARPSLLVDIARIAELRGIELDEGGVTIKAATTQADALANTIVQTHVPLLAKALSHVGHPQTRNRGTIGGSIANADPAAEICLAALALDCDMHVTGPSGSRVVPATGFFQSAMTTALAPDECLTAARVPFAKGDGKSGSGFQEVSIRGSDFALVAVAVRASFDDIGVCRRMVIALGGCGGAPIRLDDVAAPLVGTRLEASNLAKAARMVQDVIAPQTDIHASADYRRRVAGALVERTIIEALRDAGFKEH